MLLMPIPPVEPALVESPAPFPPALVLPHKSRNLDLPSRSPLPGAVVGKGAESSFHPKGEYAPPLPPPPLPPPRATELLDGCGRALPREGEPTADTVGSEAEMWPGPSPDGFQPC